MKVTKSLTHHIRMGPYESLVVGTSVEVDTTVDTNLPLEEAMDHMDQIIADSLEPDIRAAKKLAVDDSYIHDWSN